MSLKELLSAHKDSFIEALRILFGNKVSRAGFFLTILGATSLIGWVDDLVIALIGIEIAQPPPFIKFIVMLIGVGLLLVGNKQTTAAPTANPHDIELLSQFRTLITDHLIDFLRHHNFATPWRRSALDPLAELAEVWKGARYEFVDQELNIILDRVKAAANEFEELITLGTWPLHNNPELQTTKTNLDYAIGTQRETIEKIRQIHTLRNQLLTHIDELERSARSKLPGPTDNRRRQN